MLKFYYFNKVFARGEAIRMALHRSGAKWQDIRLSREEFTAMKPNLLFHQIPMLELPDKTALVQSVPILNYLGSKYALRPSDPLLVYKGEATTEMFWSDFYNKYFLQATIRAEEVNRD